jgi:hypothetical protein
MHDAKILMLGEILANSTSLMKMTDFLALQFVKFLKKSVIFCLCFDGVMDTRL